MWQRKVEGDFLLESSWDNLWERREKGGKEKEKRKVKERKEKKEERKDE